MLRKTLLIAFSIFCISTGYSQRNISDTTLSSFIFHVAYSFQSPYGDLTEFYGINSTIGGGITYKTDQNWLFATTTNFIFGDQVNNREKILSLGTTSDGEVIDGNGTITSLTFFERGFHVQAKTGKVFNLLAPNPNSGVFVMGGIGYLQHRIRIETQFGTAPQLMGDYAKGYDKLRGGFALTGEAGYLLMSNSRILNFSLSLEVIQAWTKNLRPYDFIEMKYYDDKLFSDTYLGVKIHWMIPTYQRAPDKYYYD
ncbi:MAG: hypothetical protein HOO86_15300 [Bacteroidales bacterium]|nr:hypothetical protein [Bacteroidales bacterium]